MKSIIRKTFRFCAVFLLATVISLQSSINAHAELSVPEREVVEAVNKVVPTVEEIARKLWNLSEVPLLEVKSSAYLKDVLKKDGFTVTAKEQPVFPRRSLWNSERGS